MLFRTGEIVWFVGKCHDHILRYEHNQKVGHLTFHRPNNLSINLIKEIFYRFINNENNLQLQPLFTLKKIKQKWFTSKCERAERVGGGGEEEAIEEATDSLAGNGKRT